MEKNLISRVISRDEKALEEMMIQCRPLICYVVRPILKNEEDVEEAVNDTMLKVWNSISSFDESRGSFNSWITVIAHNIAVDKLRKREKTVEYDDSVFYGSQPDENRKGRVNDILEVVNGMSKKEQQLFYKKYYYQLSVEMISAEMGMSKKAVESSLYRIRNRIRERLENKHG